MKTFKQKLDELNYTSYTSNKNVRKGIRVKHGKKLGPTKFSIELEFSRENRWMKDSKDETITLSQYQEYLKKYNEILYDMVVNKNIKKIGNDHFLSLRDFTELYKSFIEKTLGRKLNSKYLNKKILKQMKI